MGYGFSERGVQDMQWHTFVYYKYILSFLLHSICVLSFNQSERSYGITVVIELASLMPRSNVRYEYAMR